MGVLTEKELIVSAEEAGALVVLKPVKPDKGADALIVDAADAPE